MTVATQVREHGMLFDGGMVRATFEERKAVTRRLVTSKTSVTGAYRFDSLDLEKAWADKLWGTVDGLKAPCLQSDVFEAGEIADRIYPKWRVGDLLWVRETHVDLPPGILYRADEWAQELVAKWKTDPHYPQVKWTPSIFMPRSACRLLLEVTKCRAERLQDITDEDALAEGLWKRPHKGDFAYGFEGGAPHGYGSPRGAFRALWDSLNAKRAPWSDNPWVWVVSFRLLTPNSTTEDE